MPDAEEEDQQIQQEEEEEQPQQQDFVEVTAEENNILPDPVEDDALTKFNAEWSARLEEKKEAERALQLKTEEEAKRDLDSFNSQRDARLNSKKEVNRSNEQVFLERQESELDGNTWDRVSNLIEANVDDNELEKADVSRMRKLFIQLKNEPLEATRGAAVESK